MQPRLPVDACNCRATCARQQVVVSKRLQWMGGHASACSTAGRWWAKLNEGLRTRTAAASEQHKLCSMHLQVTHSLWTSQVLRTTVAGLSPSHHPYIDLSSVHMHMRPCGSMLIDSPAEAMPWRTHTDTVLPCMQVAVTTLVTYSLNPSCLVLAPSS